MKISSNRQYSHYVHSSRRIYERYGTDILLVDYQKMINKIREGDATFLQRMSRSRSIFKVELNGTLFIVVYDKNNHNIVTFLPPNCELELELGETGG
jgi:hypothetical protein